MPRRDAQYTSPPGQVAVARMTPPAQAAPAPTRPAAPPSAPRPSEPPEADSDSTRPMIRDSEIKTATPVLPLSALSAAGAASGRPLAPPPPIAAAPSPVARPPAAPPPIAAAPPVPPPPAADPLEDWSLELRPPQPDRSPPRPEAPPRVAAETRCRRGQACRHDVVIVERPRAGRLSRCWLSSRSRSARCPCSSGAGGSPKRTDQLLIVPTALTLGMAIVVFGPPLLVALGAGILLAWWLRRG